MSKLFEKFMREEEWTEWWTSLEMMLKILKGATYGQQVCRQAQHGFWNVSSVQKSRSTGCR